MGSNERPSHQGNCTYYIPEGGYSIGEARPERSPSCIKKSMAFIAVILLFVLIMVLSYELIQAKMMLRKCEDKFPDIADVFDIKDYVSAFGLKPSEAKAMEKCIACISHSVN